MKNNLPPAPVYWISLQKRFDDMVVGTYGRGIYIMDDISPIRELAKKDLSIDQLLPTQSAYRFQMLQAMKSDGSSLINGRNPSYGANIDFYLSDENKKSIFIEIKNKDLEVVRTLNVKKFTKGVNRIMWDLRYEPTTVPKLRVDPDGVDWVKYNSDGWRPLRTWDLDVNAGKLGPLAVPGQYSVTLKIDGKEYSNKFEVLKDPNTIGTLTDINDQFQFLFTLRNTINETVDLINKIENIRFDLQNNERSSRSKKLERELYRIESNLFDTKLTGAREDAFRNPNKIYGRLAALGSDLTRFGSDFKPTDQQVEVYNVLSNRLIEQKKDFDKVMKNEFWYSEKK